MSSSNNTKRKEIKKVLLSLKKRIEQKQTLLHNLVEFRSIVQKSQDEGLFDRQDIEWVEEIQRLENEIQDLDRLYKKKKHLYHHSIVHLEDILQRRKQILDEADQRLHVFSQCPRLLKQFSQKHVTLMKTVDQMKYTFAHE